MHEHDKCVCIMILHVHCACAFLLYTTCRRSKKVRQLAVHYVKEGPEADTNDADAADYLDYGISA